MHNFAFHSLHFCLRSIFTNGDRHSITLWILDLRTEINCRRQICCSDCMGSLNCTNFALFNRRKIRQEIHLKNTDIQIQGIYKR